jgi:hypothetical protein
MKSVVSGANLSRNGKSNVANYNIVPTHGTSIGQELTTVETINRLNEHAKGILINGV